MTFNSISYLQDLPLLILLFAIFFQSATICNRKNITSKKVYDMFQYYLIHYFNFKNAGGFMLVSLLCLIAVLAIVILAAKLKKHYKLNTQDLTPKQIRKLNHIHKIKEISLIESWDGIFQYFGTVVPVSLLYYRWTYSSSRTLLAEISKYYLTFISGIFCIYDKLVRYPVRSVNCNSDQTKGVRAADLCLLYYSDLIIYQVHLPWFELWFTDHVFYHTGSRPFPVLWFYTGRYQRNTAGCRKEFTSSCIDGKLFCHRMLVWISLRIPVDFQRCDP